jgi:hypothetical protein
MLIGPRGSAAANPTTAEIKKSDRPEWDPERKLWANMAHVHTGKNPLLHEKINHLTAGDRGKDCGWPVDFIM